MTKLTVFSAIFFLAALTFGRESEKLNNQMTNDKIVDTKPIDFVQRPGSVDLFNKDRDRLLKNRRQQRPVGVNLMAFGPGGLAGVSMDGFLGPKFAIEAGAGIRANQDRLSFEQDQFSYFIGGRYHFLGGTRLNLTPYVGAYTAFHYNGNDVQNHNVYFPLGIHRIKKNGFNWAAEIAYQRSAETDKRLHGSFKIGYRF